MGLLRKILSSIVLVLISQHIIKVIYLMGYHKNVYNHSPGPCYTVPGIQEGSEDMQTLSDGTVFITSGLKWGSVLSNPLYNKRKGRIFMFDFNNAAAGVTEVAVEGVKLNNPHGIGIWEDGEQVIVFIVNHFEDKESVVQLEFDRERKVLQQMKTITDPLFIFLNDVIPTGPNSFYATNFCGTVAKSFHFFEMILLLKWGSVVHFDGTRAMLAAEGLNSPNGVNLSPDGKFAYVASSLTRTLHIYKRQFDHRLEHYKEILLYTGLDNIDVDKKTGDLWLGTQPATHEAAEHLDDPTKKCTSQVLRLKMKDGDMEHMEEVYSEDDQRIHCATVATYYKGAMLAGTILDKMLYCEVKHLD